MQQRYSKTGMVMRQLARMDGFSIVQMKSGMLYASFTLISRDLCCLMKIWIREETKNYLIMQQSSRNASYLYYKCYTPNYEWNSK